MLKLLLITLPLDRMFWLSSSKAGPLVEGCKVGFYFVPKYPTAELAYVV
jgi:hypothetical protein